MSGRRIFIKQVSSWLLGASAGAQLGPLFAGCQDDERATGDNTNTSSADVDASAAPGGEFVVARTAYGDVRGRERAKRPVMFWIHGGGFQAGSGSSPG